MERITHSRHCCYEASVSDCKQRSESIQGGFNHIVRNLIRQSQVDVDMARPGNDPLHENSILSRLVCVGIYLVAISFSIREVLRFASNFNKYGKLVLNCLL